ncbi:hypothetical protein Axi01nite_96880 [Actinoplanes xinjiangensis]|nr:hypothetical protein Axi01nite_96880 [Actinoplanes xinjiangensis]
MARGGGIRWLGWQAVGVFAVVAGVLVLGTRLTADQLSTADQVASVVAAVMAVLGVPIAVYGVVLARRGAVPAAPATGGDLQQKVRSGRDANVAGGICTSGVVVDDGVLARPPAPRFAKMRTLSGMRM